MSFLIIFHIIPNDISLSSLIYVYHLCIFNILCILFLYIYVNLIHFIFRVFRHFYGVSEFLFLLLYIFMYISYVIYKNTRKPNSDFMSIVSRLLSGSFFPIPRILYSACSPPSVPPPPPSFHREPSEVVPSGALWVLYILRILPIANLSDNFIKIDLLYVFK